MVDNEKMLAFIKINGPILPMQLAKEFKQDSIIMGAVLSSLAGQKKLIISTVKIGGSPVYYLKEQEAKLQDLYKYLNEKDQRAYDLLKEKQILRDSELTPLLRVSLRAIKDFAKSVPVQVGVKEEIFWRWYLMLPDKAAEQIQAYFEEPKNTLQKQDAKPELPAVKSAKSGQKSAIQKEKDVDVKAAVSGEIVSVQEEKKSKIKEKQGKEESTLDKEKDDEESEDDFIFETKQATLDNMPTSSEKQTVKSGEKPGEKKPLAEEQAIRAQEAAAAFGDSLKDKLHTKAKEFFMKKGIIIRTVNVIKANSEIDYVVFVPTPVGNITYFGKARSKKKISETDLAAAFIKGQNKKLPVLFITSGELTKKAIEMLRTDFENIRLVKLE